MKSFNKLLEQYLNENKISIKKILKNKYYYLLSTYNEHPSIFQSKDNYELENLLQIKYIKLIQLDRLGKKTQEDKNGHLVISLDSIKELREAEQDEIFKLNESLIEGVDFNYKLYFEPYTSGKIYKIWDDIIGNKSKLEKASKELENYIDQYTDMSKKDKNYAVTMMIGYEKVLNGIKRHLLYFNDIIPLLNKLHKGFYYEDVKNVIIKSKYWDWDRYDNPPDNTVKCDGPIDLYIMFNDNNKMIKWYF